MKWSALTALFGKTWENEDFEITGVQYDSRKVASGNVFVCIPGTATDGHKYASTAVENGARGLVVEHPIEGLNVAQCVVDDPRRSLAKIAECFYGEPHKKLRLIGITGTNGKTTTTHLVREILEAAGRKTGLMGTNHILIGEEVIPATHTTPESLEISAYLKKMADAQCEYGVMEVSSHGLKQGRVSALEYCGAAFTNLTQDHLDYHHDFSDYLASKQILFNTLEKEDAYAVINIDDPYGKDFVAAAKGKIVTYGLHDTADYCGSDIHLTSLGTEFTLRRKGETFLVKTPLLGDFNVYNVLATIGILECEGVDLDFILKELSHVKQVRGRFEKVKATKGPAVVVDYAHSPDGLKNIMETARSMNPKRLILVFGCGGDRDKTKRPIMGKIGGSMADFAVVTSDNPRTEEPMSIISMVEAGVKESGGAYTVICDRRKAIKEAILMADDDDLVVIAGKGHEDYQILGKEKVHFDDFEEAEKALALK